MKKILQISLAILLMLIIITPVSGDRGSIPFNPGVNIYEPKQQAVIAWNGNEQILVLSTDLHASEATKVLEVMPLPSEPAVRGGDIELFQDVHDLYFSALRHQFTFLRDSGRGENLDRVAAPAGKITFREQIGAHDITVTQVLRAEDFIDWVNDFLSARGVETPDISQEMQEIIQEYISEGFTWFVFDVVELTPETRSLDAIEYRFESDGAFFPLRITRTESGYTEVEIMTFMPPFKAETHSIQELSFYPTGMPVVVRSEQIENISPRIAELLDGYEYSALHHHIIHGKLSNFNKDFLLTAETPEKDKVAFYRNNAYTDLVIAEGYTEQEIESLILGHNKEVTTIEGKLEEKSAGKGIYGQPAIDNIFLFDSVTGEFLREYHNLMYLEDITVEGFYREEVKVDDSFLTNRDEKIIWHLYKNQLSEEERDDAGPVVSGLFVTNISGFKRVCGRPIFTSYHFPDMPFCFWTDNFNNQ